MNYTSHHLIQRTRAAFLWTRILGVPFWGLVSMLSIILYKDMHVTPLQITAIIALKPISALLAPYWSQAIYQRPDRVISNLVWSNILRFLPFLFMPWIDSPWIIIAAFGLYMMFYRGVIPAWMEMIKCNLPNKDREHIVALGSAIDYGGTALLPLALGFVMDEYALAWKWLFPLTAILGLLSTWFLYRIPVATSAPIEKPEKVNFLLLFKDQFMRPWKQSWSLIRDNTGFVNYQIGFMLGGAGLMIIQPAIPIFFVDTLNLSYTKMMIILTVCKGIGLAMASPFWLKLFRRMDIYYFSGLVTVLAAIFPILLMSAELNIIMVYFAYLLYGIMQAGSELSWHMSGPVFAKESDSSIYSGTNVLTVGIRGCIVPLLGAFIFSTTNSTVVMVLCSLLCLFATRHLMFYSKAQKAAAVLGTVQE